MLHKPYINMLIKYVNCGLVYLPSLTKEKTHQSVFKSEWPQEGASALCHSIILI